MISKVKLKSIIDKYYLGVNESVKWNINDNFLEINFMTPTKDVIGQVTSKNFNLKDSQLAIYNTKRLQNLVDICEGDLVLDLEKNGQTFTKLYISDLNFNLTYPLSDILLIRKVNTVNTPQWDIKVNLEPEDISNLIKAKMALPQINYMSILPSTNLNGDNILEFIFGGESNYNDKIDYHIESEVLNSPKSTPIPFDSNIFKSILSVNKDMESSTIYFNSEGLIKFEFSKEDIYCEYFLVRKSETEF
jgi:hypothetical protein